MTVKQIEQSVVEIDLDYVNFLHELAEQLDKAKEDAPKGVVLQARLNSTSYDGDYTSNYLVIYYMRDRTEEELAFEKRMQDRRDEDDMKIYLRLKAKFEPQGV